MRSNVHRPPYTTTEQTSAKFSGDFRTYPVFRNRFIETARGRSDLEPRHKFQYLLQCLDGEPLRLANGYLITDNNYFKILDRLEDRYGDSSTLVNLLAQEFVTMKSPFASPTKWSKLQDAQSLRNKIYEKLRKDPLITPVHETLSCISDYVRMLEKGEVALSWNVTADRNSGRSGPQCRTDPRSTGQRAEAYATDADVTYAANTKPRRKRQCTFCGRDHWASQCNIYVSISQRIKRLRQLNYCLLCLRAGHWTKTCTTKTDDTYKYCHGPSHHRALCKGRTQNGDPSSISHRRSPVSAPTPGVPGILKNEHGSSSQQEPRDTISVSRTGVPGPPTAKTVRFPSTHHSSMPGESNSKRIRRKKLKDPRTDPQGRVGTTRPTTAPVAENVKQMGADACGGDGLLSGHSGHLTTDRRSTTAEPPWDDRMPGDGFCGMLGVPDAPRERGPWAYEEASLPPSVGHCSDADTEPSSDECDNDPRFAPFDIIHDYSGYAVSTTSPADNHAVLLECLKTTAVNINNGLSCAAIAFFDSGSNVTYISMRLAHALQLPQLGKRHLRVNAFGTDATTTIAGFTTTLLLRSQQGHTVPLTVTASDRIVAPVTTALINDEHVALLKKNKCSLVSTREKPDLLIGQDLVELFDRQYGLKLPQYYSVRSGAACTRLACRHTARKNKTRRHATALSFELGQCSTTLGRKPPIRDHQPVTMIIPRKTQLRRPPSNTDLRILGMFRSQELPYMQCSI